VFDLVVAGGEVVDGTGAPPYRADIGITAGRIVALADLAGATSGTRLDATGRYVMPGFIDAHSHGDALVFDPALQLATLRQGVTTLVLGQDGVSFAPSDQTTLGYVSRYFAGINGIHPGLDGGPVTVAQLRAAWQHRVPVNTAYLVPLGTVRHTVLRGARRVPDAAQLRAMRSAVEHGLADGAVGVSSGLEYSPGRHAGVPELVELCRPIRPGGLPYVTHLRGYGHQAPGGMAEAVEIAATAGVALHVSHYHGPGELLASLVDDALARGLDVTFDTYPYRRGCTLLAMAALPAWLDHADAGPALAALADPPTRARIRAELDPQLWPRVRLAHVPDERWAWTEGLALPEAAGRASLDPGELLLQVLAATGFAATAVLAQPATTHESIRRLAQHPRHLAGSDGIAVGAHPHPRAWGAFARYLARFVRAEQAWSWAQAAQHLAARAATRFGLRDRGILRAGAAADLSLVDPDGVVDVAGYDDPRQPALGVADVLVNGVPVLREGRLTGALPGIALTPYPEGAS
jgi:N-acyl-D-amino-acid deacylase